MKKKKLTPADYDRWETPPGSTFIIEDDEDTRKSSRFDEIIEIDKFNPFHDSMGKFSSSNGFKSYSANPNTKAGAMAIARSAAAGHMNTINVHRAAQ